MATPSVATPGHPGIRLVYDNPSPCSVRLADPEMELMRLYALHIHEFFTDPHAAEKCQQELQCEHAQRAPELTLAWCHE